MKDKTQNAPKQVKKAEDYDLRDLLKAKCHFGHERKRLHPRMKDYIHTEKDKLQIFDLAQTAGRLAEAYNYAYDMGRKGKKMLVLGTKRQASEIVEKLCKDNSIYYINSRWLGGFLTNWQQIYKSIKRMRDIEKGLEGDKYEGYTKYEVVQLKKEYDRFMRFFKGIKGIKKEPDLLYVIDTKREANAVKEANDTDVPVIGLVDSNCDPQVVDVVIPSNDDSVTSIEIISKEIVDAYIKGRSESGATTAKVSKNTKVSKK